MLFAGVEDEIKSTNIGIPISEMSISPGGVLVQMFVDKKAKVIKGSLKKDRSGSLLTPLFCHLELDLSPYQCNETMQFIDVPYLINCQIFRDETTCSFLGKDGKNLYYKLTRPDITSLRDVVNICFVPDRTFGGDTAYDLGPLDDDNDDATYRCWMVDSQRKNNGLMKRIPKAITRGCLGTPSTTEPHREQPTPSSHQPGKELTGTAGGEEDNSLATPRRRNMRSAGQSENDDTD
ncbi:hypothetical protein DY000_02021355 [Brassica cretica]|uniref:Uncharacterized protein n=1 Tax=Brassica cretica TaxID=69181 RepID=A0ABQ7EMW5_BRACR|nr:hypothetical protein DY000_02021355 [Brassica cretica]